MVYFKNYVMNDIVSGDVVLLNRWTGEVGPNVGKRLGAHSSNPHVCWIAGYG